MSIPHCGAPAGALVRACLAILGTGVILHPSAATGAGPVLVIGGTPVRLLSTASYYSFQPDAYDSQGRALTFSIANKPAWAQFDPSTGMLSAELTRASVGFYPSIVISVSDGIARAALPAFSILVRPNPSVGAVTLQWLPPTENTDASPLVDLAGYHIYYGASPASLDNSFDVSNPGIASFVVSGLDPGTWYFAVAAYNSEGVEGELSSVISRMTQ